ncbi:MAG TPA: hypothetical protein VKA55_10065 [Gammaproteobacteria bacterium]|nr:hypothetical protein [Gammaproteobacteria bacterium]
MRAAACLLLAAAAAPAPAAERAPVAEVRAERTGDGGLRVTGRTRLAEGSRLRVALHHPDSGYRDRSGPLSVADGRFASGAFHDHAFPLPAGSYRATVLTPGTGGLRAVWRGSVRVGPPSRLGRAVALLGAADFSGRCKYPTDPFRANFDYFFHSGYGLRVEQWSLFTGPDGVERLRLTYSYAGRGRVEAIWEVDLAAASIELANTQARRLSCY